MSDTPERYALAALFGGGRNELVEHIPHCRLLGMQVVETGPRTATARLPQREDLIGDPVRRVAFGGAITTLLDHAGGLAVVCSLAELKAIATLDLRIDYVDPRETRGRAEIVKHGRRIANVRVLAWQDDPARPVAAGTGNFLL